MQERHSKSVHRQETPSLNLEHLALDVAVSINQSRSSQQRLSAKQEALLAALLTEPTCADAAAKVGVSRMTAYRWLQTTPFQQVYRQARRELVNTAVGRLQLGSGLAVDALMKVVVQSRSDSDKVRATVVILDHAYRGLTDSDVLSPVAGLSEHKAPTGTTDVVTLLGKQLQQLENSHLTASEKSRLTATLADALLRAIGVDVIDKRLEALQSVLEGKKKKP